MSTPARQPPAQNGFTVLEMLVVLSIAALLLAWSLPGLPLSTRTAEFRLAVTTIGAQLTEARAAALRSGRAITVEIDPASNVIRSGPVATPILGGVTVARTGSDSLDPVVITFQPTGSATPADLTLTHGTRRSELSVDWLTGRISIREPRGGS